MPSLEPQDLSDDKEDEYRELQRETRKLCATMCSSLMHELYLWDTELDIWHDQRVYTTARGMLESNESAQHIKEELYSHPQLWNFVLDFENLMLRGVFCQRQEVVKIAN